MVRVILLVEPRSGCKAILLRVFVCLYVCVHPSAKHYPRMGKIVVFYIKQKVDDIVSYYVENNINIV